MKQLSEAVKDQLADLENEWKALLDRAEGMEDSGNFDEGQLNMAFHQAEEAEGRFNEFVDVHNIGWTGPEGEPEIQEPIEEQLEELATGKTKDEREYDEAIAKVEKIVADELVYTDAEMVDEQIAKMIDPPAELIKPNQPDLLLHSTKLAHAAKGDTVSIGFKITAKGNRIIKTVEVK